MDGWMFYPVFYIMAKIFSFTHGDNCVYILYIFALIMVIYLHSLIHSSFLLSTPFLQPQGSYLFYKVHRRVKAGNFMNGSTEVPVCTGYGTSIIYPWVNARFGPIQQLVIGDRTQTGAGKGLDSSSVHQGQAIQQSCKGPVIFSKHPFLAEAIIMGNRDNHCNPFIPGFTQKDSLRHYVTIMFITGLYLHSKKEEAVLIADKNLSPVQY